MMHDDVDEMVQLLSRLPTAGPNAARAGRVRTRCHAVLARKLRPQERSDRPGPMRRIIEPALVSGFCLIYLSAVMVDVLRARGLL